MGLFCANFHFRTDDHATLEAAAAKRKVKSCRVMSAKNGWVSLYDERASEQDDDRIRDVAKNLSKDLKSPAIAFLVHDSDIACYWLYDGGTLLDEFNSCPDYFDDDGDGETPPSGGKTDVLVRFCRPGVTEDQLSEILHADETFAESIIEKLADALGIDPSRALADYRDGGGGLDDEDDDEDDDRPHGGAGGGSSNLERVREMMAGHCENVRHRPQRVAGRSPSLSPRHRGHQGRIDGDRSLARGWSRCRTASAGADGRPGFMRGLGLVAAGSIPQVPMTPLMAAVAHKQRAAVERLLEHGADPNTSHPLFGTSIHAATGGGRGGTVATFDRSRR